MPFLENKKLIKTKIPDTNIINGPVGKVASNVEIILPIAPEIPPIIADKRVTIDNFLLHCLAATGGITNIAVIRITPAICIPIITLITIIVETKKFILLLFIPRVFA